MDVGFQYRQILGPTVRDQTVNQSDNLGGKSVGIVADLLSCEGKGTLLTSPTFDDKSKVNLWLERWLSFYNTL